MKGSLSLRTHERKDENWVFMMSLKLDFSQETSFNKLRINLCFQENMEQVQLESEFH
jgi:hypothetical protein